MFFKILFDVFIFFICFAYVVFLLQPVSLLTPTIAIVLLLCYCYIIVILLCSC